MVESALRAFKPETTLRLILKFGVSRKKFAIYNSYFINLKI